jgi:hypothetical protein
MRDHSKTIKDLKRLADHPNTSIQEAAAANRAIKVLLDKYEIEIDPPSLDDPGKLYECYNWCNCCSGYIHRNLDENEYSMFFPGEEYFGSFKSFGDALKCMIENGYSLNRWYGWE